MTITPEEPHPVEEMDKAREHYSGRSMGDSHRHLMITDDEWLAVMDDLQQTLNKFEVASAGAERNQDNCREHTGSDRDRAPTRRTIRRQPWMAVRFPGDLFRLATGAETL
jgi:hypothetical protein